MQNPVNPNLFLSPDAEEKPLLVHLCRVGAIAPQRGSDQAAGYDLFACFDNPLHRGGLEIPPMERASIPIGIKIAVPLDTYGRIAPRSGMALRNGIDVLAGVIDPDYRGEIHVLLYNSGEESYIVKHGDRIAQLILERCLITEVWGVASENELPPSRRGDAGWGSTGV